MERVKLCSLIVGGAIGGYVGHRITKAESRPCIKSACLGMCSVAGATLSLAVPEIPYIIVTTSVLVTVGSGVTYAIDRALNFLSED